MQIFPRNRNSLLLMNCSSSIQSRIFWRIFTSHEKMPRLQVHRCIINFYPWHFELRSTKGFFSYSYLPFLQVYDWSKTELPCIWNCTTYRHIHIKLMTVCSKVYFFVETSRGIKNRENESDIMLPPWKNGLIWYNISLDKNVVAESGCW